MALFQAAAAGQPPFNVRAVEAGDAPEMVTRLTAAIQAAVTAGDTLIVDLQIAGAGAGPQWQSWLMTAPTVTSGASLAPATAVVFAQVAGNPVEALLYLNRQITTAGATDVFKVIVAGAGLGPTYMGIALTTPT